MADTTGVYAISVDSTARKPTESDTNYFVPFGKEIPRVKTIQLGSVQIPDCRYAFGSQAEFDYIEPSTVEADCYLTLEETVTTTNTSTCEVTRETHQVSILIPPTLNAITDYNADTVTLENDAGLDFILNYYPLVGLQGRIVGAHYPQSHMTNPMPAPYPSGAGPVIDSTTVTVDDDNSYTYVTAYLDALNTTTTDNDTRHYLANNYTSYLYAEPALPVEMLTMVNAAINDLVNKADLSGTVTDATNASPIVITTAANHGLKNQDQVTISDVEGNTAANGQFLVNVLSATTFELVGSTGNAAYTTGGSWVSKQGIKRAVQFGFDGEYVVMEGETLNQSSGVNNIKTEIKLLGGSGSFAEKFGFGAAVPGSKALLPGKTTVPLRAGNYSAAEVASIIQTRMNPLLFDSTDASLRTLRVVLPTGEVFEVVIPQGQFTPTQMVDYLNYYLNQSPANITVSYSDDKFTFAHNFGLSFTLQFSGTDNATVSTALGFENVDYTGSSSYTSPNVAVYGSPSNNYTMAIDSSQNKFTFSASDPQAFLAPSGTDTVTGDISTTFTTWNVRLDCDDATDSYAHTFQTGDIVRVAAPYASGNITAATNASPIEITSTGHTLTTGDSVTISCVEGNTAANGTWYVTVLDANTFTLDGSEGNGTYTSGGLFLSNSFSGDATNVYTAVVREAWDASSGLGSPVGSTETTLVLEPTASIFSAVEVGTVHESIQTPADPANIVQVVSDRRNVFQLFFTSETASATNLGFPRTSWPPSSHTLQSGQISSYSGYDASTQAVPVSSTYTAPYCWSLTPPPYLMLILEKCASRDTHTHVSDRDAPKEIFAKLMVTAPFLHISEEMMFYTFASNTSLRGVHIRWENPDGTPPEFNGQPHTTTWIVTSYQGSVEGICH